MISVQIGSWYIFKHMEFQVVPPNHFSTCNSVCPKQSQVIFTISCCSWASCINILLDFRCNCLEQQVPKPKFCSKLPHFTLLKKFCSFVLEHYRKTTSRRIKLKWEERLSPIAQFTSALLLSYKSFVKGGKRKILKHWNWAMEIQPISVKTAVSYWLALTHSFYRTQWVLSCLCLILRFIQWVFAYLLVFLTQWQKFSVRAHDSTCICITVIRMSGV